MAADIEARSRGIYALLNQDQVWVDAQDNHHQIDDMDLSYKANVVAFIERRANAFAQLYSFGEMWALMPYAHEMSESTEDHFEAENDRRLQDPLAWIRTTKLVQRLINDIAAANSVQMRQEI